MTWKARPASPPPMLQIVQTPWRVPSLRGIEDAVPMLHGSQGCATYMRRYIISHFREPMDIASSALGEKHAVYGGGANLKQASGT